MSFETGNNHQREIINMSEWSPESIAKAENEITAIMQLQNPTGRTHDEADIFRGYITRMKRRELTPGEAILKARYYADSRQDGHGGGSIQDGY